MAARNKPAGIRSLVYGVGKGKVRIESLSVSFLENPFPLKIRFFKGSVGRFKQNRDSPQFSSGPFQPNG